MGVSRHARRSCPTVRIRSAVSGADGDGGDAGPVAIFGTAVPEAEAVLADLGLAGDEELAVVLVGGGGVDAEQDPVPAAATGVDGDGVVAEFFEAHLHALAAAALLRLEGELGEEVLGGVFLAEDAKVTADGVGVAGAALDDLNEIEDAVEGTRGHGRGGGNGRCGGGIARRQGRRAEGGHQVGGGTGAAAKGLERLSGGEGEGAHVGEPLTDAVLHVEGVGHGLGDLRGGEREIRFVVADFVGEVSVPVALFGEDGGVVALAFHGWILALAGGCDWDRRRCRPPKGARSVPGGVVPKSHGVRKKGRGGVSGGAGFREKGRVQSGTGRRDWRRGPVP